MNIMDNLRGQLVTLYPDNEAKYLVTDVYKQRLQIQGGENPISIDDWRVNLKEHKSGKLLSGISVHLINIIKSE